jgi:diguanylate cyclase (GGDEF)-like protein
VTTFYEFINVEGQKGLKPSEVLRLMATKGNGIPSSRNSDSKLFSLDAIFKKLDPEERAFLSSLIDKDPVTGIYNRRKFNRDIELVAAMHKRSNKGSALLIMDIDHFKKFNDEHGHQRGDEALREVSQSIQRSLRDYDKIHIYRYGGEEFMVIISDVSLKDVRQIGDRIRKNVMTACPVTISVGISHYKELSEDLQSLVDHADRALYEAKKKGRNRVEVYSASK